MRAILKGPGLVLVLSAALLLLATGGLGTAPAGPLSIEAGEGFPLARWLARSLPPAEPAAGASPALLVGLAALSAAAAFLFGLFFVWTGNRIASVTAALLFALHPLHGEALASPSGILRLLPLAALFGAVLARERARAAGGAKFEALAVAGTAIAVLTGPLGVVAPAVLALSAVYSPLRAPGEGRSAFLPVLPHLAIAAAALLVRGPEIATAGGQSGFPARLAHLLAPQAQGPAATLLGFLLLGGLAGLLLLSIALLGRSRRWLIHYGGLASAWLLAAEAFALAGLLPSGSAGLPLGLSVLVLLPPLLAWRLATDLLPPEPLAPAAPPLLPPPDLAGPASAAGEMRRMQRELAALRVDLGRIAEGVQTRPLASAARSLLGSTPGKRRQKPRAATLVPWMEPSLEESVFEDSCRPHLSPGGTVVEIGMPGGGFTGRFLEEGQRVVTVSSDREGLRSRRAFLGSPRHLHGILASGPHLHGLATATADFAFAFEALLMADQATILACMRELARVLRPGGRAVLVLGNLLDPAAMEHLVRMSDQVGRGARPGETREFLSPDLVRAFAGTAGLDVEAIELSANNVDMLVTLERPAVMQV